MKKQTIYSYSKINLSLRVIKKLKNNFHSIQSLITFVNICDKIVVKEEVTKKDIISFFGPFKKNISKKNNTINKTLNILRDNNYLNDRNFKITITKNIPTEAGLGGGSMNAASLLTFFNNKYKLKISNKKMIEITSQIGSDVILGLKTANIFFGSVDKKIIRYKNNLNLFLLIVKPSINCSTRLIYKKNSKYSKKYKNKDIKNFNLLFKTENLKNDTNDLEKIVFKKYPRIMNLYVFLKKQKNCEFSRMSGSGSVCVGYFKDLKSAKRAKINTHKKFPKYWCKLSKAM